MTGFHFTAFGPQVGYAPTGNGGTGPWLLPARSWDARVYQSVGVLCGQPGTQMIPAPDAAAIPPGDLPTMARGKIAWPLRRHRSSRDSPQVILPALYYQRILPNDEDPRALPNTGTSARGIGLGPNVSWVSDNQMPVPAMGQGGPLHKRSGMAVMARRPPRIGGRAQVAQPYSVVGWPKWVQTNPPYPA